MKLPLESSWVFAKMQIARLHSTHADSEAQCGVGGGGQNCPLPPPLVDLIVPRGPSPGLTFQAKSGISSRDLKVPHSGSSCHPEARSSR